MSRRLPRTMRPSAASKDSDNGMVAAELLPNAAIVETTLADGTPSCWATAAMMRAFA